jgi:hypothetical protein
MVLAEVAEVPDLLNDHAGLRETLEESPTGPETEKSPHAFH